MELLIDPLQEAGALQSGIASAAGKLLQLLPLFPAAVLPSLQHIIAVHNTAIFLLTGDHLRLTLAECCWLLVQQGDFTNLGVQQH